MVPLAATSPGQRSRTKALVRSATLSLASLAAGQLLPILFGSGSSAAGGNLDIGSIIAQIASGGVGGGVLMAIIGLIRQMMAR